MPEAVAPMMRFGALLEGRLPDRVPVVCNLFEQGAGEMGMGIREYYSRGEYVAEGQLKLLRKYGHDNVWGVHYAARDAEILGSRNTIFSEDGPPNVGHLVLKGFEDIESFEIPEDLAGIPAWEVQVETLRILKAELAGTVPVCAFVIGSFSLPPLLMGMERWLSLLWEGPLSLRRELLTQCSDFTIRKIRALRDAGADMISYSNPVASVDFFTPGQCREMALEWIVRDFTTAGQEGLVYFNGGGRINPLIRMIFEEAGARSFYIHPDDDIVEAKEFLRGKGVLAAAINDIPLLTASREEIDAEVRRIVEAGMPGGGFIFGTLVMPYHIPDENIRTLVEAAHRYGAYAAQATI